MESKYWLCWSLVLVIIGIVSISGCVQAPEMEVPHEEKYGIYALDLSTQRVQLIYSTANEIYTSTLRLNNQGDTLVFAQKIGGDTNEHIEIFTIRTDGSNLQRITTNSFWDLYPTWSPDGTRLAFISMRNEDLDIYIIGSDGSDQKLLYDSGYHDADIDWRLNKIVFTSNFAIWTINDDGTQPTRITNLPNAGQWGNANLPIGDYDPRFDLSGEKIVFERLEDPSSTHGDYNIFVINSDGTGETRLTNTGYSQGLASWSNSGNKIVYIVAAIKDEGKYDMYMMNADGSNNHDITPKYFPPNFLVHSPIFSKDDSTIFFIGQWWE